MKKKKIILVLLLAFVVLNIPEYLLNNGAFQGWFLRHYRPFAPWEVRFDEFKIRPWSLRLSVKGLTMTHPDHHAIAIQSLVANARFLPLILRGHLKLEPFEVSGLTVTLAKPQKVKRKKKKFKLRTLLFLKNLVLDKGEFRETRLVLANKKTVEIKRILLTMEPFLMGGSRLFLQVQNTLVCHPSGDRQTLESLELKLATHLEEWSKSFPYADNVEGDLRLRKTRVAGLDIDDLTAGIKLKKQVVSLENFSALTGKGKLDGNFQTHLVNQNFLADLKTPQAIPLPNIGDNPTFDFSGQLLAEIHLKGQGWKPRTTRGNGTVKLRHIFSIAPKYPAELESAFRWGGGRVDLEKAVLETEGAPAKIEGSVDLSPPALHLKIAAKDFPIQRVFEKFRDDNLHPIFGRGTFEGTVEGLKKNIQVKLKGDAIDGGYGLLHAERLVTDLDINYDRLLLEGEIFSGGQKTGNALLTIQYGGRVESIRSKVIDLEAEFKNQPLQPLLPTFEIQGTADAHIKLHGPPKSFEAEGNLSAKNGSIYGQGFESVEVPFTLTPRKLTLANAVVSLTGEETKFVRPLEINLIPGGFTVDSSPTDHIAIDLQYFSRNKLWVFREILFRDGTDPTKSAILKGTLSSTSLDLTLKGDLGLEKTRFLSREIRNAEGIATADLRLFGTPGNILAQGDLTFHDNTLSLRSYPVAADELRGTLKFRGNEISTEDLSGLFGNGPFLLKGSVIQEGRTFRHYNISLRGKEIYYRNPSGHLRVEYNADVRLEGPADNPTLRGSVTILDGRYTKDFRIIEELRETAVAPPEIREAAILETPINLQLRVRNRGELIIDNNIGRIELSINIFLTGTQNNPKIRGNIDITHGEIIYLGLDMDITRGFMEFRRQGQTPYLEIHAEKELPEVNITAFLHGNTNNLRIDLGGSSTRGAPLDKRDVLSLALYGMTARERANLATFQQLQLGPELVAEQIAHMFQRPFAKATHLDVFRIETIPSQEGRIQRFHVGKRLSDRLTLEFSSEIAQTEAIQTFGFEYWLTDFFIVKALRTSEEHYQLGAGFRFTSR